MRIQKKLHQLNMIEDDAKNLRSQLAEEVRARVLRWIDIIKVDPRRREAKLMHLLVFARQFSGIFVNDIEFDGSSERVRGTITYGGGNQLRLLFDPRILRDDESGFAEIEAEVQANLEALRIEEAERAVEKEERKRENRRALLVELMAEFGVVAMPSNVDKGES